MKRNLLFAAATAALLTVSALPAYAGAGAIGAAQAENNDRGRGNGGGERRQESPRNNDGDGRPNRGDDGGQRQAQPQPRPQQEFRNNDNGSDRRQWQGQTRDNNRWAGQPERPRPQQGLRDGDNQRRIDNNRPNNNDRRFDNNNRPNDDRRWAGNNNNDRRWNDNNRRANNGWNHGWNDNRNRRSYAAIPYGGYFGPSYGSIVSRYYGRNYVYYGSRPSWGGGWNRPYRVGYLLPPSLYCTAVPYDLYYDLPPPPYGYDYALCGRDILLVGLDSNLVIDAIVGW